MKHEMASTDYSFARTDPQSKDGNIPCTNMKNSEYEQNEDTRVNYQSFWKKKTKNRIGSSEFQGVKHLDLKNVYCIVALPSSRKKELFQRLINFRSRQEGSRH